MASLTEVQKRGEPSRKTILQSGLLEKPGRSQASGLGAGSLVLEDVLQWQELGGESG